MKSLIFLTKKKDGITASICTDRGTKLNHTQCNEAASPTAMIKAHLFIAVIDTKQGRDIMTANIPNIFLQTHVVYKPNGKKTTMKMNGTCVNMLVDVLPQDYQDFD